MKLKNDVLVSANDGLVSDNSHLTTDLRETKAIMRAYEGKCSQLLADLTSVTKEY